MKIIKKKRGRPSRIAFPITEPVQVPDNWTKNIKAYTAYWRKKGYEFDIGEENGKLFLVPKQ